MELKVWIDIISKVLRDQAAGSTGARRDRPRRLMKYFSQDTLPRFPSN